MCSYNITTSGPMRCADLPVWRCVSGTYCTFLGPWFRASRSCKSSDPGWCTSEQCRSCSAARCSSRANAVWPRWRSVCIPLRMARVPLVACMHAWLAEAGEYVTVGCSTAAL
eukprot:672476-Rhodomonas_salina.1